MNTPPCVYSGRTYVEWVSNVIHFSSLQWKLRKQNQLTVEPPVHDGRDGDAALERVAGVAVRQDHGGDVAAVADPGHAHPGAVEEGELVEGVVDAGDLVSHLVAAEAALDGVEDGHAAAGGTGAVDLEDGEAEGGGHVDVEVDLPVGADELRAGTGVPEINASIFMSGRLRV